MNKPPAFQFYASDFLASTDDMTNTEVGAYVRALAHSWDRGPLPKDQGKLARLLHAPPKEFKEIWPSIHERLTETDEGYINDRLETERAKQAAFRAKQANNGRASAASKRQPEVNQTSTVVEPPLQPNREPEVNSPSPSPSPSLVSKDSAKNAEPSRAPLEGGVWRQRSTRDGLLQNPIDHRQCYISPGCDRGLCVPRFVSKEWLGQCEGDAQYIGKFIASTLRFTPVGPQGDPAKWWRAKWDEKHRTPIGTTKGSRTVAAGRRVDELIDSGAELDPFGTKADAREAAKQLEGKASA